MSTESLVDSRTPLLERDNPIIDRDLLFGRTGLLGNSIVTDSIVTRRRRIGLRGLLREQQVQLLDDRAVVLGKLLSNLVGNAVTQPTQGGVELAQARVERTEIQLLDSGRGRRLVDGSPAIVGGLVDAAGSRLRRLAVAAHVGDDTDDGRHDDEQDRDLDPARPAVIMLDGHGLQVRLTIDLRIRGGRGRHFPESFLYGLADPCTQLGIFSRNHRGASRIVRAK